jgi:excisionase family DNA binding protein
MEVVRSVTRPNFMNVGETAEFLRIARKTIYGLVSQRRIPFRKAGRRLLFLESELVEWTRPTETRMQRKGIRDSRAL